MLLGVKSFVDEVFTLFFGGSMFVCLQFCTHTKRDCQTFTTLGLMVYVLACSCGFFASQERKKNNQPTKQLKIIRITNNMVEGNQFGSFAVFLI